MKQPTYILSIAGYDPSAGAGLIADLKTFEHHKLLGMGVQTANTIQTEDEFLSVNWVDESLVFHQLRTLLNRYGFQVVKVGLVPSVKFLNQCVDLILDKNPHTKIIWDPVLSSSTDINFQIDISDFKAILSRLFLITPNWNEAKQLTNQTDAENAAQLLSKQTKVILKGGHHPSHLGLDFLFENGNVKSYKAHQTVKPISPKHGSGCVFSSALASHLAKGYPLHQSILRSKRYMEHFLSSNQTLLGTHRL